MEIDKIKTSIIIVFTFITHLSLAQKSSTIDTCPQAIINIEQKADAERLGNTLMKQMQALEACMIGKTLPEFNAVSREHGAFGNNHLKNKIVLLNFWFIGCHPCEAEMPLLNQLYEEYRDKEFLLLSFSRDDEAQLQEFLKETKVNFPIVPNASSIITKTFNLKSGYPTTIILNRKGEVVEYKAGGPLEEEALKKVKAHLTEVIDRELRN